MQLEQRRHPTEFSDSCPTDLAETSKNFFQKAKTPRVKISIFSATRRLQKQLFVGRVEPACQQVVN